MDAHRLTLALVEAQVGSLVDVLPVALLVTNADGDILRANTAAMDLFGPRHDVHGGQVKKLLPFVDDFAADTIRGAIYTCGRIRPVDVRLRKLQHDGDGLRLYVIHEV